MQSDAEKEVKLDVTQIRETLVGSLCQQNADSMVIDTVSAFTGKNSAN